LSTCVHRPTELNFESWFGNGSPSANPTFGAPIELSLNNHGIRSLAKNANNNYLIVAGSYAATGTFELYSWNGQAASAPVLLSADLTNLKPEGIVDVPADISGAFEVDLISDLGANIMYADGVENKDVAQANHRKFLTSTIGIAVGGLRSASDLEIAENNNSKDINYLNTTSNKLTIGYAGSDNVVYEYFIYSITGSLIKVISAAGNMNIVELDLSDLAPGLYLIQSPALQKAVKIIKQ